MADPISSKPAVESERSVPKTKNIIAVDAMGGDLGAYPVVKGMAKSAKKNETLYFHLYGDVSELKKLVARRRVLRGRVEIHHVPGTIRMDEKPSHAARHGKNTSMWAALDAVREGKADACVSCGNTGALMALSMMRLRKLPGVNRPAIAVLWPSVTSGRFNVMLDVGADIRADARDLLQYALMGMSYARNGLNIQNPRIGLLNVGTEDHKGRTELQAAYSLLTEAAAAAEFEFVGFIEGNDIASDKVDVIVTDGFTGNIALKTGEGTASLIRSALRDAFRATPLSRLAALLAYTSLQRLTKRIDPRRVNGGVFLGLNGTVVKSHGSADATGVSAAIKLAFNLAQSNFTDRLAARLASTIPNIQDKP